ncbi:MAG: NAD(P)/FAD-dependent oxidoreductase [Candidatus Symbiothrix sp.]|jgi:NADH dehydrogenase|nr:NAD(P)/FAD-dependent oxidoreductase [Candidatus Symbiothrix sp.]
MSFNIPKNNKKRVIVVGGGFGGLNVANELENSGFQVVLIDKNNYHQFLPLIYQVASAGIEPSSISFPFRKIAQKRKDFFFRLCEVRTIVPERNLIQTSIGKAQYDYIVFAAGTISNYFGNQHIENVAIPMKNVSEAMGLRNALLSNLERAVTTADEEEKRELLNIVIVGGGATGVEIAGAISEMKRFILPKDYPEMDSSHLHIYLIEAADRLLSGMSKESSAASLKFLREMGVKVLLNEKVIGYEDHQVLFDNGGKIPTRSFIWVSGVTAVKIGNMPSSAIGRGNRIQVDEYNRVKGFDNVFSIGDQCIQTTDPNYPNGHPQVAQVAIQQAKTLAKNLKNIEANKSLTPFRYKDLGSMATVGRNRAVAEIGKIRMNGWFAWLMWLVVHLRPILGIRNKLVILFDWIWNYITYGYSLRLIIYASKAKEIQERDIREANTHLGEDILK